MPRIPLLERRKEDKQSCTNSCGKGAYSYSQGILGIKEEVCKFIKNRDGVDSKQEDIFLKNGTSALTSFPRPPKRKPGLKIRAAMDELGKSVKRSEK